MRTNQNSTKKKAVPKIRTPKESYLQYMDMYSFKMKPIPESFLDALGRDLVEHMCNTDAITIENFLITRRIPRQSYYDWLSRNENLKAAHDFAIMVIAEKREVGCANNKLNQTLMLRSLPIYSDLWRKREIDFAALSKSEEKPTNVTVYMDAVAETPEVVKRIEEMQMKELKKKALTHD